MYIFVNLKATLTTSKLFYLSPGVHNSHHQQLLHAAQHTAVPVRGSAERPQQEPAAAEEQQEDAAEEDHPPRLHSVRVGPPARRRHLPHQLPGGRQGSKSVSCVKNL